MRHPLPIVAYSQHPLARPGDRQSLADRRVLAHENQGTDNRVVADARAFGDDGVCADRDVPAKLRVVGDDGAVVNTRHDLDRRRCKALGDDGERRVRVFHPDECRRRIHVQIIRDDGGRSLRRGQKVRVLRIGDEGKVTLTGPVDRRQARHDDPGVSDDLPVDLVGQFGQCVFGHDPSPRCGARSCFRLAARPPSKREADYWFISLSFLWAAFIATASSSVISSASAR